MKKKTITDPKMKMMIEFFGSRGAKFVDIDTGEELIVEEENENNTRNV